MSGTRRLLRGPALVAIAAVAFVLAMPASALGQSACADAGASNRAPKSSIPKKLERTIVVIIVPPPRAEA